ncbi:MAG: TlpA family protein disulfide reductase [Candidatus Spyradosoma sp.]
MKKILLSLLLFVLCVPAFSSEKSESPWEKVFPDGLVKCGARENAAPNPELLKKLDGKFVGIYYTFKGCGFCDIFRPQLEKMWKKNKGIFEVVVWDGSKGKDRVSYQKSCKYPWAVIPAGRRPAARFSPSGAPDMMILSPDGRFFDRISGGKYGDARFGDLAKNMKAWMEEHRKADERKSDE